MVGMSEVEVNKDDLLEELRKNRAAHRQQFEKALEGYSLQLGNTLRDRIHQLEQGKIPNKHISLPEPEDHTSDYDRVIKMVEMNVDDTVHLTQQEFAHYVLDDWGWKQAFTMTSSRYGA